MRQAIRLMFGEQDGTLGADPGWGACRSGGA
jgi:hypothetical protein